MMMNRLIAQQRPRSFFLLVLILTSIMLGIFSSRVFELPPQQAALLIITACIPFVLMMLGNVRKILLAIILVDIPFQIDSYLFNRWGLQGTGAINGVVVSISLICLVGLYALWATELAIRQQPERRTFRSPSLPLVIYILVVIISGFAAKDNTLALFEIFLLAQVFLIYFYIINNIRSRDDLTFILVVLLSGLLLEFLVFVFLIVIGHSFEFAGLTGVIFTGYGGFRIGGTLQSPNGAGSYLAMVSMIALAMLFTSLPRWTKYLAGCTFFAGLLALVFTFSRGAWLALALSTGIFTFVAWRRSWLRIQFLIFGGLAVLIFLLMFNDAIMTRLISDDAGSAIGRIPQYLMALRMIQDYPIIGVGANNYIIHFNQYLSPAYGGVVFHWVVHNKYLLVWAETGILGLSTYLWFLISAIRKGFRISNIKDSFIAPLALGFSVAIIGQMVHMFVDIFHSRPQVELLWLVIGLITCLEYMQNH